MKKLFTILPALLIIATVWAQSPQKMSYQAVIRTSGNALVTSAPVGMRVSILQGSSAGTEVYKELFNPNPQTNANGLVTIEIGGGIPLIGTFSGIDWSADTYFIKIETDPTGGTNYSITGTSQLLSVPYALHAKTAESISGTVKEKDPVFVAWDKSTGIGITASQVSDFQTSVTNNTSVLANTAKNSYPPADAAKLAGIEAGAEVNVNADWNALSGDMQILHKPTLATVATSGSYDDLSDRPTISAGTNIGDMQYWNGTAWVMVPVGEPGQFLKLTASGVPAWSYISPMIRDSRDGHVYKTVIIGTQTWMAENLAYLPSVSPSSAGSETDPYFYVFGYENSMVGDAKSTANYGTYGVLYNWPATMNGASGSYSVPSGVQGICPSGWHLPSDAEWAILTDYLAYYGYGYGESGDDIGKSMSATSGWIAYSTAGTIGNDQASNNRSGFAALPGGCRGYGGTFSTAGNLAFFWSSSENGSSTAWYRNLTNSNDGVSRSSTFNRVGCSVRCLQN